jgi:hypothetical protein
MRWCSRAEAKDEYAGRHVSKQGKEQKAGRKSRAERAGKSRSRGKPRIAI